MEFQFRQAVDELLQCRHHERAERAVFAVESKTGVLAREETGTGHRCARAGLIYWRAFGPVFSVENRIGGNISDGPRDRD